MNKTGIQMLVIVGFVFTSAFSILSGAGDGQARESSAPKPPVGLSLFFQNGQMAPIRLYGDAHRYLQEIDIVASVTTQADQGIEPLIHDSEFSRLDWRGIKMVEEDWRQGLDGTFTRQRFYRGAKWMERPSVFLAIPTDDSGAPVGLPLLFNAGIDDYWSELDDGFVRRFVARQIATGCRAVGDCEGATFTAQGLAQARDAMHADQRDLAIPAAATRLSLKWSADPAASRLVSLSHSSRSATPYDYGFQISLDPISNPANGSYFMPGESVSFRVTFRDGSGNRLHPQGSLPTYGQFVRGEVTSGLRYHDFSISPTLYYGLKHRESNMERALSGPTDNLRNAFSTVQADQLPLPQVTVATVAADGFSGVAQEVPEISLLLAGLSNPAIWDTPVSDILTFTVPNDALPGTYVAAIKARREFGGEALNRAATTQIQVGTARPSTFTAKTGNCNNCHQGASGLGQVLHGVADRRACFMCHTSLFIEPDAALDIRVHEIHDRSERFPGNVRNCALCHLTPPDGPARGLLGK
jgi:hypothetical protein